MKEKWTQDLQKKMTDYEVPTIPDGLWEEIDSALHTNTQHLTPNTSRQQPSVVHHGRAMLHRHPSDEQGSCSY